MFLDQIIAAKKIRVAKLKDMVISENYSKNERKFYDAIKKEGLSIIGEIKRASPSLGLINEDFNLKDRVNEYGLVMDAISILTEEDFFLGSSEDLIEARQHISRPILMKDFIINEKQIYQAKQIGADCILLIATILNKEKIQEFFTLARKLGLDAIVEVHNDDELTKALATDADMIGINNRDLVSFVTDLSTTEKLAKRIPDHILVISESGIKTKEDIKKIKNSKVNAVLIGESFMRTENIQKTAEAYKNA